MKAIIHTRYGPPEVLELGELPKPVPKNNEVLIRVYAATATPGDGEMRSFKFQYWWLWPVLRLIMGIFKPRRKVLGMELAGLITQTGEQVTRYKPGDCVVASAGLRFGGYAEYACLPESAPMAVLPDNVTFAQAVSLPVGGINGLHFMRKAKLNPGDQVLINGAGGVIGTYALQIAKMMGAHITGVDAPDKLQVIRETGADQVLDYTSTDIWRSDQVYDVVFDVTGKIRLRKMLGILKSGGKCILANPRVRDMLGAIRVNSVTDKAAIFAFANDTSEDLAYLANLIAKGKIRPVIDRTFPLDKTADAHRYVASGKKVGVVVIEVRGE